MKNEKNKAFHFLWFYAFLTSSISSRKHPSNVWIIKSQMCYFSFFLPHYVKLFSWAFTIFGTFPHHNRLIVSSIRSHFDFGLIIGISYKFWNSCWRSIVTHIFTFSFYLYIDISKESVLLFINGRSLLPKLSFRGMYSTKYIWS